MDFATCRKARREGLVKEVFSSVAARYDLMNDLMSAGVHRIWKDAMVEWLNPRPGWTVLDVAGGTGDIAFRLVEMVRQRIKQSGGGDAAVTVCDINADMLGEGRRRAEEKTRRRSNGSAAMPRACRFPTTPSTPTPSASASAMSPISATRWQRRGGCSSLGGRFLCLEFSKVEVPGLDVLYDAYSFKLLPRIGAMVAKDEVAYRYLAESIRRFPPQAKFAQMIADAGLEQVKVRNLSGGIAAIHSAWRL